MEKDKAPAEEDRTKLESARASAAKSTAKASAKETAPMPATESRKAPPDRSSRNRKPPPPEEPGFFSRVSRITGSAFRLAKKTTDGSIRVGKALIKSQDQLRLMLAAGESLRDLREVAGLTISDLSDALNLKDKSLLEAVEDGTATLSFELILRLSALLARNDPIPFILRFTRTYNPELWKVLHDWGLGRIPLQYERERQFINIYRRQDAARALSDEGFQKVLGFTRNAFEMALHFIAEQEHVAVDEEVSVEAAVVEEIKKAHEQDNEREGDRDSKNRERDSRRNGKSRERDAKLNGDDNDED